MLIVWYCDLNSKVPEKQLNLYINVHKFSFSLGITVITLVV